MVGVRAALGMAVRPGKWVINDARDIGRERCAVELPVAGANDGGHREVVCCECESGA